MSGGSFNYTFRSLEKFVDNLKGKIKKERSKKLNAFNSETMEKLETIKELVNLTTQLMREVEYLYSGDTSEDSFMHNVKEILTEFESSNTNIRNFPNICQKS